MIEERRCSYEVCKLLHEKGFDVKCTDWFWENYISIWKPTHQMACDWLMEKDIYISPKYSWFRSRKGAPHYEWKPVVLRLSTFNIIYPQLLDMCEYYKTYGEAVDAAIKYSLENLVQI